MVVKSEGTTLNVHWIHIKSPSGSAEFKVYDNISSKTLDVNDVKSKNKFNFKIKSIMVCLSVLNSM